MNGISQNGEAWGGQNDRLNFSFVKDSYVGGKKMALNSRKTAIYQLQIFSNR